MQITRKIDSREAAKHLNLSYSKITKLRVYGGGPRYYQLGGPGSRVVYDVADLDAWAAQHARTNTSQSYAA